MQAAFPGHLPPGVDAVCSVSMHSEGRYAFVELRTPEMASAALQLSNQARRLAAASPWMISGSCFSGNRAFRSCKAAHAQDSCAAAGIYARARVVAPLTVKQPVQGSYECMCTAQEEFLAWGP